MRFLIAVGFGLALTGQAFAQQAPVPVVASFSILGDLVRQVGGERVAVTTLVGVDGDAHVYTPAPNDAAKVAQAKLIVQNGLNFEPWLERLVKASGTKANVLVASRGITLLEANGHDHGHNHGHHAHDPHTWHNVQNVKQYVANIRDSLISLDPDGREVYTARTTAYILDLEALDKSIREQLDSLPKERRTVITGHDAFGYFAKAYGLTFKAPQGVSTESEASAKDVARIIKQIRRENIPAIFLENISDPRLVEQIARETGAKMGGRLYSDALSKPEAGAGTYIDMMRYNLYTLMEGLRARS
jgi:zinc/manganese transport system substrate-binding protein